MLNGSATNSTLTFAFFLNDLCILYYDDISDWRKKETEDTNGSELFPINICDAFFDTVVYCKQCYRLLAWKMLSVIDDPTGHPCSNIFVSVRLYSSSRRDSKLEAKYNWSFHHTFFVFVFICDVISVCVSIRIIYPRLLCKNHPPNAKGIKRNLIILFSIYVWHIFIYALYRQAWGFRSFFSEVILKY